MNNDDLKKMVQLYFDGELEKNREPVLFTLLSGNEEAREYFRNLNVLHSAVEETIEDFPEELEERIFRSIEKNQSYKGYRTGRNFFLPAASLSIAALMLIISIFLFFEVKDYRGRIENISRQVSYQNRTIELILNNTLPPAEVGSQKVNEIIVEAKL